MAVEQEIMNCRFCESSNTEEILNLGFSPLSNAYLEESDLNHREIHYPLRLRVCLECWLVQTEDAANKLDMFNESYAYLSSASSTWVQHTKAYSKMIAERQRLDNESFVVELACNDGCLLSNFLDMGIPCLGVEPTLSTAKIAEQKGLEVLRDFFGGELARKMENSYPKADLIVGNNVLAHVPNINDFVQGLKFLLGKNGVVTLEFPHLKNLVSGRQFDTIYHEHFSYLSLFFVDRLFSTNGLKIFDVECLSTHGGSLRVYGCHQENNMQVCEAVSSTIKDEIASGLNKIKAFSRLQKEVEDLKNNFVAKLIELKWAGKRIVAYGAAAKGNTLLNFSGLKADMIECVFDASIIKQGKYLPGSHIPILAPEKIQGFGPDVVVILPWNLADEIVSFLKPQLDSDCEYLIAVPELKIL